MNSKALDHIDRLIINSIQKNFPVESRPYEALAARLAAESGLALTGEELLARVKALKEAGYIRRLGAVFDARKLGCVSSLCAARVPGDRIEAFAAKVNEAPQVTHNYLRSDDLNVWFTFTAEKPDELPAFLEKLRRDTGVAEIFVLESEKLFKIKVDFKL